MRFICRAGGRDQPLLLREERSVSVMAEKGKTFRRRDKNDVLAPYEGLIGKIKDPAEPPWAHPNIKKNVDKKEKKTFIRSRDDDGDNFKGERDIIDNN
jgi:hypothetical protein